MHEPERGGAVNVQMALLWPVLLLLIFTVIQFALVYYAGQLALTAAEDGLRAGRYYGNGSPEQARTAAQDFLTRTSGNVLTAPSVTAELADDGATLRVTVTGEVLTVVPGFTPTVNKHAAGALERVTP